jgi:hypothetical protein
MIKRKRSGSLFVDASLRARAILCLAYDTMILAGIRDTISWHAFRREKLKQRHL